MNLHQLNLARGKSWFRSLSNAAAVLLVLTGCERGTDMSAEKTNVGAFAMETAREDVSVTADSLGTQQDAQTVETSIRLVDEAKDRGLQFERFDDMQGQRRILEVNGGGVGVVDVDGDGWLDLFLPNGCEIPISRDSGRNPGQLFRNLRGRFQEISESSRLEQFGFGTGVAAGDVNEDGFPDLYITRIGTDQLWLGMGDGTFVESTASSGIVAGSWGSSVALADLNGDGVTDFYVVNYLQEDPERPRLCREAAAPRGYTGCTPAMFPGVADHLYLGDGSGRWEDVAPSQVETAFPGKGLGVLLADLNHDHQMEIYVANDGQPNFLLRRQTDGSAALDHDSRATESVSWRDAAAVASLAVNDVGYAQASMGIAFGDFDRRSGGDLFLTHFYRETNTLYLNSSVGSNVLFEDSTRISRLGPASLNLLGFGTAAVDFDRDGWEDLIVANGHIDDRTWFDPEQSWQMPIQVFHNTSRGVFVDVSSALPDVCAQPHLGRGLARGDFDRDGLVDVVISNQGEPAGLLMNRSQGKPEGFTLRMVGVADCRRAIGTKVRVKDSEPELVQQLASGGSFQSEHAAELVFTGITEFPVELEVTWMNGSVQSCVIEQPGEWICRQGGPVKQIRF